MCQNETLKEKVIENGQLHFFRYDILYVNDGLNGWDYIQGVYPFGDGSIDYIFNPIRTAALPPHLIQLHFTSDGYQNYKGFLIQYRIGKKFKFHIFSILNKWQGLLCNQ